ncbi:hypothetical protein D018_3993B, partial [Vibrio parahaemolyticus VP2007-007]
PAMIPAMIPPKNDMLTDASIVDAVAVSTKYATAPARPAAP